MFFCNKGSKSVGSSETVDGEWSYCRNPPGR